MRNNKGFTLFELMIVVVIVGIFATLLIGGGAACQAGGMGPEKTFTGTVLSKHTESKHNESHYMVTTDTGTFEVDNGPLLGVWNSDDMYGRILVGHKYIFHTKGKQTVNWIAQYYPYIVGFEELMN